MSENWDQFLMLVKLTNKVETFIQPLILACYGINIYIILLNVSLPPCEPYYKKNQIIFHSFIIALAIHLDFSELSSPRGTRLSCY